MGTPSQPATELRYSAYVLRLTGISLLIVAALTALLIYYWGDLYHWSGDNLLLTSLPYCALGLTWLALLYIAVNSPLSYKLSDEGLSLRFLLGSRYYDREHYEITSDVDAGEIAKSFRLWGSGGFLGYVGRFNVSGRGICHFYLTSMRSKLIRLRDRQTGTYTYVTQ